MEIELWRIIMSAVIVIAAIVMAVVAVRSFRCKGPLISHAWTMATPEQRKKLDKKAEYRGVAVVMGGLSAAFVFIAAYLLFSQEWTFWLAIVCAGAAVLLGMTGGMNRLRK